MTALDATRAALDAARVALASAEQGRDELQQEERDALVALSSAGDAYGDRPCEDTRAAWREAREARELAGLAVAGAERRIAAARVALASAEQNDARARLDAALLFAGRDALFNACERTIADLADLDAVPTVDPFGSDLNGTIEARLMEQGVRDGHRRVLHRRIRIAVQAQAAAVEASRRAAHDLGQDPPPVEAVPEAQLHAAAALEVYAARNPQPFDREWWVCWLVQFYPPFVSGVSPALSPYDTHIRSLTYQIQQAFGYDVDTWLSFGRETYRSGNPDMAQRLITQARRTADEAAMEAAAPGPFVAGAAPV